jgi:rod shape determining protein RodA
MTLLARDPRAPFTLDLAPLPRRRPAAGTDWILIGAAVLLATLGALLVWSATRAELAARGQNPQTYLYRHLANLAIAAVLLVLTARLDARQLRLFGPLVYLASLIGLAAVFVVGTTVNGAHAWIQLGSGFQLQPAEFMKLGLVVGLAVLFAERCAGREFGRPARAHASDVFIALALTAVPLALILLQPDLGSALVLAAAACGVLVAAGTPTRWTVGLVALGVLGVVLAVRHGMLADYQLARFRAFAHPDQDVQGAAYSVTQARLAIARGGVFGAGLVGAAHSGHGFVPEQQTDFVFSVAGEELGFVGAAAIIVLVAILCWRGLRIAAAADRTGRLLATGVVCWLAFQAFENIGMNLGLTPVTGLPLPFVSYGGSSMFAQGMALGLLLAVRRRQVR